MVSGFRPVDIEGKYLRYNYIGAHKRSTAWFHVFMHVIYLNYNPEDAA